MNALNVTLGDERFDFGKAFEHLRAHRAVARAGWNGKTQSIMLEADDPHMEPFLAMRIRTGPYDSTCVPWVASQTDVLATDWAVVA